MDRNDAILLDDNITPVLLELNKKYGINRYVSFNGSQFDWKQFLVDFKNKLEPTPISGIEFRYDLEKWIKTNLSVFNHDSGAKIFWDFQNTYTKDPEDFYGEVYFSAKDVDIVVNIINQYCIKKDEDSASIELIGYSNGNFYTIEKDIEKVELDLSNYNKDFKEFDSYTSKKLGDENGIVILHGEPGTGKSYYIRSLVNKLGKEKKFLYLPPFMANSLADPSFIPFILRQGDNSIIIVEDSEEILKSGGTRSTAVSNILNFSDGLLSDVMNTSFLFTFNMDIHSIDPAILRKGRLISKYKFEPLQEDSLKELNLKLGTNNTTGLLCDIYNEKDNSYSEKTSSMGFIKV